MSFFSLLLSVITNPHLLRTLGGLLVLVGTWYLCRVLGLSGNLRLLVMAVMTLLVIVVQVLLTRRAKRKREQAADDLETSLIMEADQSIAAAATGQKRAREEARRELVAAIEVLKRSQLADGRGGRAALYVLPWYLVLGPEGAGKSGLIRNSGLQPPDKGPGDLRGIGASANCEWWFTNHAVVLEADRRFAAAAGGKAADSDWLAFLSTLRKQRPHTPLNGVVIAVPASDLLTSSPAGLEAQARLLRRRLDEIGDELKLVYPVYVVVTKLDLVHGFDEYFAGLDGAGGEQVLGCTLRAANQREGGLENLFAAEFGLLYQNLCRRRQMRLVQAEHQPRREGTYLFPLEMRSLGDNLQRFVKTLCENNAYGRNPLLRGFYFTSVGGDGLVCDPVRTSLANRIGVLAPATPPAVPGRPLFLRGFFRKILVPDRDIARPTRGAAKRLRLVRRLAQVAVLGAVVVAGVAVAMSFAANLSLVRETARLAGQVSMIPRRDDLRLPEVDGMLGQLDALQEKLGQLDRGGPAARAWRNLGLYRGHAVNEMARQVYLERFLDIVQTPYLDELRRWLLAHPAAEGRDDAFYQRYRVFRMLREPAHAETPVMIGVLSQVHDEECRADAAATERLADHLTFALGHTDSLQALVTGRGRQDPWDSSIIDMAEQYIIAHWELDSHYQELIDPVNFARADLAFGLQKLPAGSGVLRIQARVADRLPDTVPAAYTRRGWEEEVSRILGDARALEQDSWMLPDVVKREMPVRHEPLLRRYADEYIRHWREFLGAVVLDTPGSLAAAERLLLDVLADDSAYRVLLDEAESNLDLQPDEADAPAVVAALDRIRTSFDALHALLRRDKEGKRPLDSVVDGVKEVAKAVGDHKTGSHEATAATFTRRIFASDEPDRESPIAKSMIAAEHALGAGGRLSDPDCGRALLSYLNQPALAAWQAYLRETESFLDREWTTTVRERYSVLAGRYPLARDSSQDASLDAFGDFFHAGGTLQTFVTQHLAPYVEHPGFAPRLKNEAGLNLGGEARAALNAGLRINLILFGDGGSKPSCEFSVKPGQARVVPRGDLHVTSSTLQVGRTELRYDQGSRDYLEFKWPPRENSEVAVIRAVLSDKSIDCKVAIDPGHWALFRLIDRAAQGPEGATRFTLTWKVPLKSRPGLTAELPYEFLMKGEDHALLRSLTAFDCPQSLFSTAR
ncbi:MAG: type VI secretion system membrane subunit TssM [bacterium]|nr:type VI secretion system membrane subunit TssM [bacterium]